MSSNEDDSTLTEAERNLRRVENKPQLHRFVFTGGPCGGKTTSLARVFSFLRERGFEVINCPEAYTILNSNGMSAEFFSTEGMDKVIQGTVLDCQLAFENGVQRVLEARGKPAVMLCDRGTMDGSIFIGRNDFEDILKERNSDIVEARDNRYDAIFHLVTAADGAEAFYTLENNKVRWESKEEARHQDKLIQQAWTGHPHLYVMDNSTDFEGKMNRLIDIISKIVGLPSNLKRRSARFLLKSPPDITKFPADVHFQVFEVEKVYLQEQPVGNVEEEETKDDKYSFIRRRSNLDPVTGKIQGSVYQITRVKFAKTPGSDDSSAPEMIEQKRIIPRREYETAYVSRDPARHIVKQRRISFLYEKQSFNIHVYEQPVSDICILHAQVEAGKGHVDLPPFLEIERELNPVDKEDNEKFGAYSLSIIHKG